jgi:hypothetical protein
MKTKYKMKYVRHTIKLILLSLITETINDIYHHTKYNRGCKISAKSLIE